MMAGEQDQSESVATLGGVLYARGPAPVPEHDWAQLVDAIADGNQVALHSLYDRANRIVFTLALRLTANPETAEEVTIDVFHDIWRRASSYEPENGTVIAWIMNQARSRSVDRLRFDHRKKRTQPTEIEPASEPEPDPRDVLELREQNALLRVALEALTADEREAIETTFFGGLTHVEAARRLDQPLGTVKTRIRSGLHKLRSALPSEARES